MLSYIEKGVREEAKLVLDGKKPNMIGTYIDTWFIGPTVFEDVTMNMVIAQEEFFGMYLAPRS